MIRHIISMVLACYAMFGFIYTVEGDWVNVEWLKVFIIYSSIALLSHWVTWIVMTFKESNKVNEANDLKY